VCASTLENLQAEILACVSTETSIDENVFGPNCERWCIKLEFKEQAVHGSVHCLGLCACVCVCVVTVNCHQ